jgi:hypothetical protein
MEKQFNCSKCALKKARITFLFYVIGLPVIAVLFVLPYLWNTQSRFTWHVIIYVLLAALFIYQGYRSFRVLRSLHQSCLRTDGVTVSGIHTKDPFETSLPFQIGIKDITDVKETIIATTKKEGIDYYPRTLHRAPFESPELRGYRSTILKTEDASYILFGIELTDDVRKALKPE